MQDNGSICKITIDGTDFKIQEPQPFDRKWYSHKFKGPGLRYEVGLCIQTGWIVWLNGPYPCGSHPDLKIARLGVFRLLAIGEMVLADGGYRDGGVFAETPTGHNNNDQKMKKLARARHETVNKRLKQFNILANVYRCSLDDHGYIFRAITIITQIAIQTEEPLFSMHYKDN
jgi:hypothetical protein